MAKVIQLKAEKEKMKNHRDLLDVYGELYDLLSRIESNLKIQTNERSNTNSRG